MKRLLFITSVFTWLLSAQVCAQDIHYSQFFNTPLNISPGLAGNFNGQYRFGANLKQQWQSVPVDYKSFDLYADFKTSPAHKETHWNLGFILNYDDAGEVGLQSVGGMAIVSYALRLNDNWKFNPGIGIGFSQRRFDVNAVTTANQWNGLTFDPGILAESLGSDALNFLNLSLGASFRYWKSNRTYADVGASVYNINSERQSFNDNTTYLANLAPRINGFILANIELAKDFDIVANAVYQVQKPASEIVLNAQLKYYLDKYGSKAIYFGGGMRLGDAWYPMIAVEFNEIYAAFSYDLNISEFEIATNGRGGPELSFRYLIANVPFYPKKPCPIY